jgi:DNA-binding MarR family transcriptional regulator
MVPAVRWLDPEEQHCWRAFVTVYGEISAALNEDLVNRHNLDEGDYAVLVNLSEAPGRRLRMCDLAGRLHLSPSGLTRRLDGLVRAGLVRREPSDDDRRVIMAVLADEGLDALESAAPDHVQAVRRHLFDHLSPAQVRTLSSTLDAVARGRARAGLAKDA